MGNSGKESHKLVPRNLAFESQEECKVSRDSSQECEDYSHIQIEC